MEEFVLHASHREVLGKKVKNLRKAGILPAVIYGREITPIPISLDARSSGRVLSNVSSSSLVEIKMDSDEYTTIVRDRQVDPVSGQLLHVDFLGVSLTEKLRTNVDLVVSGDAPAVKNFGGLIVTGIEQIEIEALPQDLPDQIEIDISVLEEIGSSIFVRDLPVPPNVEILTSKDELVIVVTAPAVEPEPEEIEEGEEEEPELVDRGKAEEEEEETE